MPPDGPPPAGPAPGPPAELPFFVYGTLRPGLRNHARYLAGRCADARPAVLRGAALRQGPGYPYAVPDPGGRVQGDLLTVHPDAYPAVLAVLDRLEGCDAGGSGEYVRVSLPVAAADGAETTAWVYLAGPAARPGPPIPTGDWTRRATTPPAPPTPDAPDAPDGGGPA